MMKERFAKLLLGEDMSGGGKGVCTALAISNAITNLSGWCGFAFNFLCKDSKRFPFKLNWYWFLLWQQLFLVSCGG